MAGSFEAKPEYSDNTSPLHIRFAATLCIKAAQWWRPTSASFVDRVFKGTLLALLTEFGGEAPAARYVDSKKPEVSAACQKLFAGEAITEPTIRDVALARVPDVIRFDIVRTRPVEEDDDENGRAPEDPEDVRQVGCDRFGPAIALVEA